MNIPAHHKELARLLKERFGDSATVTVYRDDYGHRPVAVGAFGSAKNRFYSSIGVCDGELSLPPGRYELAARGDLAWLPNALASSFYWLRDQSITEWPMICEDVVRHNAKSRYRHMAYIPSAFFYAVAAGQPIHWLLGVPILDSELTLDMGEMNKKVSELYPEWMTTKKEEVRTDCLI